MTPDAFRHLPQLAGRVTPPGESALRVTPEVLAMWDERARRLGREDDWRCTEAEIEASRRATLRERDPRADLWIFSYGSLMWDPGFHFDEVRYADLHDYRRRFSYRTNLGRGSLECPGLMLTLEPCGGGCRGLAFRIPAALADAESALLWRREMIRAGYAPVVAPMTTPQGPITAVVFAANQSHPDYVGELPLDETAAIIATACGVTGTNRDYLERLAAQLALLGIEDEYVAVLLARVAGPTAA